MKTFLTLSPPRLHNDGANNAVFSHFYRPPNEKRPDKLKFGSGKVLPLDNGVYLVGGQKPWAPVNDQRPFASLKVITFEWLDIEQCHPWMTVVVMGNNYRGRNFVSRAVARVTPLQHHLDADLGSVKLTNLLSNLEADYERERSFINGEFASATDNQQWTGDNARNFQSEEIMENVAHYIRRNTNNNPRRSSIWGVSEGFTRDSEENVEHLTKAKLESVIEDSLVSKQNKFVNEDGESYQIWESTRFGPLSGDAD